MKLTDYITARGFVNQHSAETLSEILDGEKRTVYLGVDPTADSSTVGHLAVYMLLRHLSDAGHKIIFLAGGGTGMIGDPKPNSERVLLSRETVAHNVSKLKEQAESILAVENLTIVDNYDWLGKIGLIDFLRDIGKHFTANNLVKKDAIAERMKSEEGITYTEFSYPLLQAYDFLHLNREYNCDLQVGGSDQWGNITAGVDLIRRVESKTVYALTVPLVIDKATGKKFGKSEGNAVWLSAEKTSPYAFYQFWLNTSDESVEDFLKLFTVLSLPEIEAIMKEHSGDKGKRIAQRALARAVCEIVHGKAIAQSVEEVTAVFFGNSPNDHIAKVTFVDGFLAVAPHTKAAIGDSLVEILVTAQLAESKRQAREFIEGGAISINHADKVTDVGYTLGEHDFFANGLVLLKKGKVAHVLVKE